MRHLLLTMLSDITESLRARWFMIYTAVFGGLVALLFVYGLSESRILGFMGLSRLLTTYIQLCMAILPIFVLITTVRSVAGDREAGVLEYLHSLPMFRGLRLWLALKLTGAAPFRAALEEKLLLARHFYERLVRLDGFVVGPPPDLSVVTFRYQAVRGGANEFNEKLIQAVKEDGRIFLSSTRINGEVRLRLVVLGFRAHLEMIELALEILQEKAKLLESGGFS